MKRFRVLSFAALIWLHSLEIALAASLFGAELTMTNLEIVAGSEGHIVNSAAAVKAQLALLAEFTKDCVPAQRCVVETVKNAYGVETYRVTFPDYDDYWVQISTDPAVVEIQTKPATAEEYARAKPIFDELFEAGEKVGIRPDPQGTGGGHIHMDFDSTFGKDARLFRNFLVDYVNNDQFGGEGIFGADNYNAPHLTLLTKKQKEEFRKIIAEFDSRKIRSAKSLAKAVNTRVYTSSVSGWEPPVKYQALNLTRMNQKAGRSTIEFRAISPQRDIDEFIKQAKLFEARVEFLKKQPGLVKLLDMNPTNSHMKIASFRAYVEESGLDWDDYRRLVRHDRYLATANVTPLSRLTPASQEELLAFRSLPLQCESAFQRFMSRVLHRAP